jgi:hypothetical protein
MPLHLRGFPGQPLQIPRFREHLGIEQAGRRRGARVSVPQMSGARRGDQPRLLSHRMDGCPTNPASQNSPKSMGVPRSHVSSSRLRNLMSPRRRVLTATGIRPRKFYATKHAFISVALTKGLNLKFIAEYCGTSVRRDDWQHYGRSSPAESRSSSHCSARRRWANRRFGCEKLQLLEGGCSFHPKNSCRI